MSGIGLFLVAFAYAILYWGVNAIQEKDQGAFITYVFPFAK